MSIIRSCKIHFIICLGDKEKLTEGNSVGSLGNVHMKRINQIINNDSYIKYTEEIKAIEAGRKFCRHGIEHCLDVARIMMLLNYEEQLMLPKEMVYAAALLHDIGRGIQYQEGVPHEAAGIPIAHDILSAAGFDDAEAEILLQAIGNHRNIDIRDCHTLDGILYRADKASRACYACDAEAECDWKQDKKNMQLQY